MAFPIALVAAMALQAYQQKQAKDAAKKQSQIDVRQSRANEMGAPTYDSQAMVARRKADDQQGENDYLKQLLPLMQGMGQGGSGRG